MAKKMKGTRDGQLSTDSTSGSAASASVISANEMMALISLQGSEGTEEEIVKNLAAGYDLMASDDQGFTAFQYASYFGQLSIVRAMIAHAPVTPKALVHFALTDTPNSFYMACMGGHVSVVEELLKVGGRSLLRKSITVDGTTCLHFAAGCGNAKVVELLLREGGEPLLHQTCHDGTTCLHTAAMKGRLQVVKHLLRAGGTPLLLKTSTAGCTCLHLASFCGQTEVARFLASAGGEALLLRTDKEGLTCLHSAAMAGHAGVVRALLATGGDRILCMQDTPD
jgi:ankyrin repeat protein